MRPRTTNRYNEAMHWKPSASVPPSHIVDSPKLVVNEIVARRRAAMAGSVSPIDELPHIPVGYAAGRHTSEFLTSNFRKRYRPTAMDVKPSEVTAVLRDAGVKDWVLMGLHGYVGYLQQARATEDVDVLVGDSEVKIAIAAISKRWPDLIVKATDVVVRFLDPGEVSADERPKPVIDVMLPWSDLHVEILRSQVRHDETTDDRFPSLEAALAAKYAAMISPNRTFIKKQQDAVDFRSILVLHHDQVDRDELTRLAELIWRGATPDILKMLDAARNDKPFQL